MASTPNRITALISQKKDIEDKLDDLLSVLASHNVSMETPLVTSDGYPRSDIDIVQIRTVRTDIILLKNDLKGLLDDIQKELVHFHTQQRELAGKVTDISNQTTNLAITQTEITDNEILPAFAVVQSVIPDGPAFKSGLLQGDRIVRFGSLTASNHQRLKMLSSVVNKSENNEIPLTVIRRGSQVSLTLKPMSGWGGNGLLGCHIVPA